MPTAGVSPPQYTRHFEHPHASAQGSAYVRHASTSSVSSGGTPQRNTHMSHVNAPGGSLSYDGQKLQPVPPAYQFYGVPTHMTGFDASNIDPALAGHDRSTGYAPEYGALSSPENDQGHDSGSETGPSRSPSPSAEGQDTGAAGEKGEKKKRERACDSCRGLKVKCIRENGDTTQPCKRCAKAKRTCITTPSTRKRQTNKAEPRVVALLESRVQELERTIQSLRTGDGEGSSPRSQGTPKNHLSVFEERYRDRSASTHWIAPPLDTTPPPGDPGNKKRKFGQEPEEKRGTEYWPLTTSSTVREGKETVEIKHIPPYSMPPRFDHSEILNQIDDLVERTLSDKVFSRYVDQCLPIFPALPIRSGTDPGILRDSKPVLYLTILACTAQGVVGPATQLRLLDLMRDVFADCQWRKGEKTIELMQAYHIAAMCYRPPAHFSQNNFFQLSVLGLIMGMELGLGRRMDAKVGSLTQKMHGQAGTDNRESRRSWLVNYYLCTCISIMLRRPMIAKFGRYEEECMRMIGEGPETTKADKTLINHVKLAQLWEGLFNEFRFHDPKASTTMEDRKTCAAVKLYNERLEIIMDGIPEELDQTFLTYASHAVRINIHEVALYQTKDQEIFWPPLYDIGVKNSEEGFKVFNDDQITSLLECVTASHGLLDCYIALTHEQRQFMPAFFTVRTTYAFVILVKVYRAGKASNEVRRYVKLEDLKLERYFADIEKVFARIVAVDPAGQHSKFIMVVHRLKEHYERIRDDKGGLNMPPSPRTHAIINRPGPSKKPRGAAKHSAQEQAAKDASKEAVPPFSLAEKTQHSPQHHQRTPPQTQIPPPHTSLSPASQRSRSQSQSVSPRMQLPQGVAQPVTSAAYDVHNASMMGQHPGMPPQAQQLMSQGVSAPSHQQMGGAWYMPAGGPDGQGFAAPYDEASSEMFATGAAPWQGNSESGALDVQAALGGLDNYALMDNMWGPNNNNSGYENMGQYGYG